MEEIKDQMKKTRVNEIDQAQKKNTKENQKVIDTEKSGKELVRRKVNSEPVESAGIKRLEEQLTMLKDKYDQQMEKLESENAKLKEALTTKKNLFVPETNTHKESSTSTDMDFSTEAKKLDIPMQNAPNCTESKTPVHSSRSNLHSSSEDVQSRVPIREAFSQTEKELKNASVQCDDEKGESRESNFVKETETKENQNEGSVFDSRKSENKENVSQKKKFGKPKPFSDVNIYYMMKQKKIASDHETQLMATLRGLQSEVTVKDKENRKLKTEMDLLRSQLKKSTRGRYEGPKKIHSGTQTIGLGPIVQRPYDPEIYETPSELEKENEELRAKIKSLEDSFDSLKEKRISDLKSLHQVHEEEMAKLVSKLETQSALTKHLHSLLINR